MMRRLRLCVLFLPWVLAGVSARADDPPVSTTVSQLQVDAEKGDAKAQVALGDAYFHGTGVPKSPQDAMHWWRRAADQGNGEAMSMLGTMSYQGIAGPKDSNEAVRWWQKAAEKYDLDAMTQLGFAYLLGDSVPRNFSMAYMWFNIAASNGDFNTAKLRDSVAQSMSAEMIQQAQQIGSDWMAQHPRPAAVTGTAVSGSVATGTATTKN